MSFSYRNSHHSNSFCRCIMLTVWLAVLAWPAVATDSDAGRIQPYADNPFYWQYQGEPVLLAGGSHQDNLFNHSENPELPPEGSLASHLDRLVSAGGNYVRNTMSHRDAGNEFPHQRLADGRFDLEQWNEEYWQRFDTFLRMTAERGIIVQIEVWDPYDFHNDRRQDPQSGWSKHPFNPKNNINYTAQESRLPTVFNHPPSPDEPDHPFLFTVPELDDNKAVLTYQQAFVDKILSYCLNYSHVLYTMNNEFTKPIPEWGEYWAGYIRDKAAESGKNIETTDMIRIVHATHPTWRNHLLNQVKNPALYTFLDVSQNNRVRNSTQFGWDQLMKLRQFLASNPRPINNTKVYGGEADKGPHGTTDDGIQKFWRNIMAGSASSRFHRDAVYQVGLGLNELARANLRSLRMLTDEMSIFSTEPRNDLLADREENEAYLLAEADKQYALYFPAGGTVTLDLSEATGMWAVKWLNILSSRWEQERMLLGGTEVRISAPDAGHWVALFLKD